MTARPAFSVVIATTQPAAILIAERGDLVGQVAALGGDMVLVSGHEAAASTTSPGWRIFYRPGETVLACRFVGFRAAQADIVAFIEDHCEPAADWCARILANFTARPELAMLGGAVDSRTVITWTDRMNYWMNFGTSTPRWFAGRQPCVAQFAVRRSLLPPIERPGALEFDAIPQLLARPGAIHMDPKLIVVHDQSYGRLLTFVTHFHNGRSTGGLSLLRASGARPSLFGALRLAWRAVATHLGQITGAVRRGGATRWQSIRVALLILPLLLTHGFGEVIGYWRGAGSSPQHLV